MSKKKELFSIDDNDKYPEKESLSVELGDLTNGLSKKDKIKAIAGLSEKEFGIAMTKVISGVVILLIGVLLFILGINGTINLDITTDKFTAKLINCSPGVLVTLFGFLLAFFSGIKIKK